MTDAPQQNLDWRKDITTEDTTLKIMDGETKLVYFRDEGVKKESRDYGNSIVFQIQVEGESNIRKFYVSCKNYEFLAQIKQLGQLTGLKVSINRVGSKKSDTRYTIKKAE